MEVKAVFKASRKCCDYKTCSLEPLGLKTGKYKRSGKFMTNITFMDRDPIALMREQAPYFMEFLDSIPSKYMIDDIAILFSAPWFEQLYKAGYTNLINNVLFMCKRGHSVPTMLDMLNRLCGPGKNLKQIFKCPKQVYVTLKEEADLKKWDAYRKLAKSGNISGDTISRLHGLNMNDKDIINFTQMLKEKWEGSFFFSYDTLVDYLGRLDLHEAIGTSEALQLILDTIRCGKIAGMKPRFRDSDSLMREHNVMARNARQARNEIVAKKMMSACKANSAYDYQEGVYMARAIRSLDDLKDEAMQQHNCVAGYASNIATGSSRIFVVRYTARPDESLVTVELSPDVSSIRQALLACNQRIRNKSLTDFIHRWHALCKKAHAQKKTVMEVAGKEKEIGMLAVTA